MRQLDWVEQMWPEELKNMQTNPTNDLNKMMYPKVQKYVQSMHVARVAIHSSLVSPAKEI